MYWTSPVLGTSEAGMRILIIADHLPFPPSSGASIRNYNLAKRISKEHDLWMATLVDNETEASYITDLLKFCKGIETVELKPSNALDHPFEAIQFLVSGRPIERGIRIVNCQLGAAIEVRLGLHGGQIDTLSQ